jgi:hypothetical protein
VFLVVCTPSVGLTPTPHLVSGRRGIKLANQIRKSFRDSLSHHVVVHGAELMADSRLDFRIQAALPAGWGALGLRFCILHDLFHVFPG